MYDNVNNPSHYGPHRTMESIDILREFLGDERFEGFCLGAALKYLYRYKDKGKELEDLKKARWFVNALINLECEDILDEGIEDEEDTWTTSTNENLEKEARENLLNDIYKNMITYRPCGKGE